MSDESRYAGTFITGMLAGAVLIFLAAFLSCTPDFVWHRWATEHNAAHYDSQTGKWRWNDEKPEKRP